MKKQFLHILLITAFITMQAFALHHNYEEHHDIMEHAQCEMCQLYQGFSSLDTVEVISFDFPHLENFYELSLLTFEAPKSRTSSYFSQAPPMS